MQGETPNGLYADDQSSAKTAPDLPVCILLFTLFPVIAIATEGETVNSILNVIFLHKKKNKNMKFL